MHFFKSHLFMIVSPTDKLSFFIASLRLLAMLYFELSYYQDSTSLFYSGFFPWVALKVVTLCFWFQSRDHDELCVGGMARMAIRVGDIRRSVYKLRIVAQEYHPYYGWTVLAHCWEQRLRRIYLTQLPCIFWNVLSGLIDTWLFFRKTFILKYQPCCFACHAPRSVTLRPMFTQKTLLAATEFCTDGNSDNHPIKILELFQNIITSAQ